MRRPIFVSNSGSEQAPDKVEPRWLQIAKHVAQVSCYVRPVFKAPDGEVHQAGCLDEHLNERHKAFFGRERAPSFLGVAGWALRNQLGATQGAENAFAGKWIEEARGVADERVALASGLTHSAREWADALHWSGAATAAQALVKLWVV
jgi:hypothetical protein